MQLEKESLGSLCKVLSCEFRMAPNFPGIGGAWGGLRPRPPGQRVGGQEVGEGDVVREGRCPDPRVLRAVPHLHPEARRPPRGASQAALLREMTVVLKNSSKMFKFLGLKISTFERKFSMIKWQLAS